MLFDELVEIWLDDYKKSVKHKSYVCARQAIAKHLSPHFIDKDIEAISGVDVVDVIRNLNKTSTVLALRHISYLERMYAYAYIHRITMHDPTHRVKKYLNMRMTRDSKPFLILHDIHEYFDVALREPCKLEIAMVYLTLVYSVVRLNELVLAKVEHFDFKKGLWFIPAENTKMNREHIAILPTQLKQALVKYFEWHGSEWAFPRFDDHSKPCKKHTIWDRNNKGGRGRVMLGVHTPHAFRNTFSTYANEQGWNKDYIESTLSHRTFDIRYVYNKALYLKQREEMMQWYANEVDRFVDFKKYKSLKDIVARDILL